MPLFKHSNHNDKNINARSGVPPQGGPGYQGVGYRDGPGYQDAGYQEGPGSHRVGGYQDGVGSHGAGGYQTAGNATHGGYASGEYREGRDSPPYAVAGHSMQSSTYPMQGDSLPAAYGPSGAGNHSGGGHRTHGATILPAGALQSDPSSTGRPRGEMTGRIEHALGTAIGSRSLKAKGMEKEHAARAMKIQGAELAEAERLEREAKLRRERAVAHGAHPGHQTLGGPSIAPGL